MVRRVAWVLVGLSAGCWRENPAFFAAFPEASGGPESSSGAGPDDGSSDTQMPPETGTTGGDTAASTTGEPGTTAVDTGTGGDLTSTTTGEPDPSSGTTGEYTEEELCSLALDGQATFDVRRDFLASRCEAVWTGAIDPQGEPGFVDCKLPGPNGIVASVGPIPIEPDEMFDKGLVTAPRNTKFGTIEGIYPASSLAGAQHPCLITRVGCPKGQASCSLTAQIAVKLAGAGEFDVPVFDELITVSGSKPVVISLAEFKDQDVEVLLAAFNDGVDGADQEGIAWQWPRLVDVMPP